MPHEVLILLVEDEFLIAELVEDALSTAGFVVHREATGDKAIRQLDGEKHFAGLVTDVRLPGQVTGWDIAHHARTLDPEIVVIYTSGDSGHEYKANGVPGSTFVQKPFVPDQIITAISMLLNKQPE